LSAGMACFRRGSNARRTAVGRRADLLQTRAMPLQIIVSTSTILPQQLSTSSEALNLLLEHVCGYIKGWFDGRSGEVWSARREVVLKSIKSATAMEAKSHDSVLARLDVLTSLSLPNLTDYYVHSTSTVTIVMEAC